MRQGRQRGKKDLLYQGVCIPGGWGQGDTCTPSPGNQGASPEHLPDRVPVGPLPAELYAPGGAGLGWPPSSSPSQLCLCPVSCSHSEIQAR